MASKKEIQQQWLETAMALYNTGDEHERSMLFMRTCKAASGRFTARELEQAIQDMRYWLDKENDSGDD